MESIKNIDNQERRQEMDIKEEARQNFAMWADALKTRDPKKVAMLYAADSTFLPTVSPDFKKGTEEAEGYFEHFLQKNPNGKIVEDEVQPMGELYYSHNGLYNFEIDKDGDRIVVECRFTFNWRKEPNGEWKILHHQSSVKPQP